jgi:hypothetical protein
MQALQESFAQIGAYRSREFELSGLGDPRRITVSQVTPSVFALLGVAPASGRTLIDADLSERVAVISQGLAQSAFAGRSPLGERLTLDREPYTIVGIMPAAFEFPKRGPQLNGSPPTRGRRSPSTRSSARPRDVLQPDGDRPAQGRHDDRAGHRGGGDTRPADSQELSGAAAEARRSRSSC